MTDVLDRADVAVAPPARRDVNNAPPKSGRFDYKWIALGVVLLGTIMTILDATIVNIAIPTLQTDLKAGSYADIAWVVTAYMLAQGAVIPMAGWASDRFGTKRLYLVTIALFTIASMACGVAQNLPELVIFRVLQGLGGGMLMPIGMTIIMRAVGPQNMGRVMGIFGIPMLIAPAIGPVLGGWFVQDFSWQLIFYVNVPIELIAFASAWRFLTETDRSHKLGLDTFGLLTAPPAAVAIMYAVDQSTSLGWGSLFVVSMLIGAAVLIAAFVLSQLGRRRVATLLMAPLALLLLAVGVRNGFVDGWTALDTIVMFAGAALALIDLSIGNRGNPEPLLQLRLFRDPTFSWSMGLSFIIVTALFGGMLLLPLYLQEVHGYSALETGLLLLPQAVTAAVAMPLGGYLTDRFGPRPVVATGMVMLAIGGLVLAQIHPQLVELARRQRAAASWFRDGLLDDAVDGRGDGPCAASPQLERVEHLQQPAAHRLVGRHRDSRDRARRTVQHSHRAGVVRAVRRGAQRRVGAGARADEGGVLRRPADRVLEAHPERRSAVGDGPRRPGRGGVQPDLRGRGAQHVVRQDLRLHLDPHHPRRDSRAVPAKAREDGHRTAND